MKNNHNELSKSIIENFTTNREIGTICYVVILCLSLPLLILDKILPTVKKGNAAAYDLCLSNIELNDLEMAELLNKNGIKTLKGHEWNHQRVHIFRKFKPKLRTIKKSVKHSD